MQVWKQTHIMPLKDLDIAGGWMKMWLRRDVVKITFVLVSRMDVNWY